MNDKNSKKDDLLAVFRREMKLRNYAFATLRLYCGKVGEFLNFSVAHNYTPAERIPGFLERYKDSPVSVAQSYGAIKLFYRLVVKKECPYCLDGKRSVKRLPSVLSNSEIHAILKRVSNKKHYLIIALLYGAGLL